LEGELYYDFLASFQHAPLPQLQPESGKEVVDSSKGPPVPGVLVCHSNFGRTQILGARQSRNRRFLLTASSIFRRIITLPGICV
jgi:hypothetical protein